MRKTLIVSLCLVFALTSFTAVALAKNTGDTGKRIADYERYVQPSRADISDLPLDVQQAARPSLASAAADSFHLAWYGWEGANPMAGWITTDLAAQVGTFFHVDNFNGLGADYDPLEGNKSMWCGQRASNVVPFCGYLALPGYGDNWTQYLISKNFDCDSIAIYYKVKFDSEPGFDQTFVDYWDESAQLWIPLGDINGGAGLYDGPGQIVECVSFAVGNVDTTAAQGNTQIRFRFSSDGNTSDQDGGYPSNGALIVDSITVYCFDRENILNPDSTVTIVDSLIATYYEDFEGEAVGAKITDDGCWAAAVPAPYDFFGDVYSGLSVVQEDPCFNNATQVYAFFDDPANANYACGGFPLQGVVPYENDDGLYMSNEIWSPIIDYTGAGAQLLINFIVYRDLRLGALIFYVWHIRSWIDNCPGGWRDNNNVYFGPDKDWIAQAHSIGAHVEVGAEQVQLALGCWDMCGNFCGTWGDGTCHSHTPVFDQLHLTRVNLVGPQWTVRHYNLFQDFFAFDGTLTGHVRADIANDAAPGASATLLPGDSVNVELEDPISGLAFDNADSLGPAVYAYVSVWPPAQPGKAGPELEAPEVGPNGKRFPLVDSLTHDGTTWYCFRFDSVRSQAGATVLGQYCVDLNDWVFTPGDTVCYILAAENSIGQRTYMSRRLNGQGNVFQTDDLWEALNTPLEFTCLPAGGYANGGDILYVDYVDDRNGPAQLFFDEAFAQLGLSKLHDRFDKLGPSSNTGNGL
ncbi:MAG: hypothetical protein R3284_09245, partial [Rubricoccaceae bacterium]|nr:hypothetical protein [Rubricoccaceae bacterium]